MLINQAMPSLRPKPLEAVLQTCVSYEAFLQYHVVRFRTAIAAVAKLVAQEDKLSL